MLKSETWNKIQKYKKAKQKTTDKVKNISSKKNQINKSISDVIFFVFSWFLTPRMPENYFLIRFYFNRIMGLKKYKSLQQILDSGGRRPPQTAPGPDVES